MSPTNENVRSNDQSRQGSDGGFGSGARQKAVEAYDGARENAAYAGRRASDAIDEAPLIALAGGFAAGALIAALLPKTQTESRLAAPVGEKLGARARAAAEAAREAGVERLKELGLTPEKGKETIRSIVEGASDAAKTSAQAAVGAAKGE